MNMKIGEIISSCLNEEFPDDLKLISLRILFSLSEDTENVENFHDLLLSIESTTLIRIRNTNDKDISNLADKVIENFVKSKKFATDSAESNNDDKISNE